MRPLTAKQIQRIEKKKKKLAAFLEIAKLNDKDRAAKAAFRHIRKNSEPMDMEDSISEPSSPDGPCRKRHKKNTTHHHDVVLDDADYVDVQPITCEEADDVKLHENKAGDPSHGDSINLVHETPVCDKKCITFGCGHSIKSKKKRLSDEYSQLKHEFKERRSRSKCVPSFRLKTIGELASLSMKQGTRSPIFVHDIQHILMYALLGQQAPVWPSRWCNLERHSRLSHIVVFLVEGISLYDFSSHCSSFEFINSTLENQVEVVMPDSYNGSLVEELISVPLTGICKEKLIREYGSLEAASKSKGDIYKVLRAFFPIERNDDQTEVPLPSSDQFPRTQLLLSMSQLLEQNYPVPLKVTAKDRYSEFVLTKDSYRDVTAISPMFGLDCEMCRTTSGELEVTRVSVVNENLEVVYESLVKPYNRITDYLTRYSGITKQSLSDVTVRLEDVQKDLRNILPRDAILVGQSLNADLQSLKMMHPFVIDTSVIYNLSGERNRKSKLALLAQKFLLEEIQSSSRGHCSIEDSSACIKLTQLKLANGIEYGDAVLLGRRDAEKRRERKAANHIPENQEDYAASIFSHSQKMQRNAAVVTIPERNSEYCKFIEEAETSNNSTTVKVKRQLKCFEEPCCKTVVERTCEIALEHHFTLAHIIHPDVSEENSSAFVHLDEMCKTLWQFIAVHGLFMVLFGGKDSVNGACFVSVKKKNLITGSKL